ncbi:hypothetical protein ACFVG1_05340 [Streptomyces bacillaris]|uniref:hypothetical protein n=1 Tax=Streptomyces bacillaris TaxID=68179 RepID=UPI0035DDC196
MRATAVRRTALAACAVSLTLLVTACGGSSDADAGNGKSDKAGAADASSQAPKAEADAKALSAAELETASLEQGDVEGHKVTKAGPDDEVPADGLKTDKDACLPVVHAMFGVAADGSKASAKRKVVTDPAKGAKKSVEDMSEGEVEDAMKAAFDLTSTFVALNTYDGAAGPDAYAGVKKAAAECAGGFNVTIAGDQQKIVSITEEKITGGDEAAAWTVVQEQDGAKSAYKLVALRKAGTVATFFSFNLTAGADGGAKFTLPTEVVAAQAKKLG